MTDSALIDSIRSRLNNKARELKIPFHQVLTRYGHERLLYRVQQSRRSDDFVLKGATMFLIWTQELHRPTKDADFLSSGNSDATYLEESFREIVDTDVEDDGLDFQPESVSAEEIREDEVYEGVRIKLVPTLGNARIHLQVDLGFGDAVTPGPETVELPTLLNDLPQPKLQGYPRETAVAEKYEAMVQLGEINSRMKDFYDIWRLASTFTFDGPRLSKAIRRTFKRRETKIPTKKPVALTTEFAQKNGKSRQWSHFVEDLRPGFDDPGLESAIETLSDFLWSPTTAVSTTETFDQVWKSDSGWEPD